MGADHNVSPGKRLFIGNVDSANRKELMDIFSRHGRVVDFYCTHGFGFVEYALIEEAQRAMDTEQGRKLAGKYLDIGFAKPKDPVDGTPATGGGGGGRGGSANSDDGKRTSEMDRRGSGASASRERASSRVESDSRDLARIQQAQQSRERGDGSSRKRSRSRSPPWYPSQSSPNRGGSGSYSSNSGGGGRGGGGDRGGSASRSESYPSPPASRNGTSSGGESFNDEYGAPKRQRTSSPPIVALFVQHESLHRYADSITRELHEAGFETEVVFAGDRHKFYDAVDAALRRGRRYTVAIKRAHETNKNVAFKAYDRSGRSPGVADISLSDAISYILKEEGLVHPSERTTAAAVANSPPPMAQSVERFATMPPLPPVSGSAPFMASPSVGLVDPMGYSQFGGVMGAPQMGMQPAQAQSQPQQQVPQQMFSAGGGYDPQLQQQQMPQQYQQQPQYQMPQQYQQQMPQQYQMPQYQFLPQTGTETGVGYNGLPNMGGFDMNQQIGAPPLSVGGGMDAMRFVDPQSGLSSSMAPVGYPPLSQPLQQQQQQQQPSATGTDAHQVVLKLFDAISKLNQYRSV